MNRFKDKYIKVAVPTLTKEFSYTNAHQVPRLTKVVVSAGVGRAVTDSKHLEAAGDTLGKITGQYPVTTVARKSIASFKLREGNKVGTTVTLRGSRAEEFLDQLTSVVLPRVRSGAYLTPHSIRLVTIPLASPMSASSRRSPTIRWVLAMVCRSILSRPPRPPLKASGYSN